MTDLEVKQMIKSMAYGMSFEEISAEYECDISEVEKIYKKNREEVAAEIEFNARKGG